MYLTTVYNGSQMFPSLGELGKDNDTPNHKQQRKVPFVRALHALPHFVLTIT